ncbi:hypothetical protein MMC13_005472 [Lambiella insularis]|nr:hypothetical protein [Lambiella insularis]
MPSRNIVQDSDDEGDGDIQPSPPVRHSRPIAVSGDGMEFVDFGSSSPAQASSSAIARRSTGNGSAEALSQAIHKAHHDLVEASPDQLVTSLRTEGVTWSITSPIMEKVKRRKTTMEEFGSATSSSTAKGKKLKTYGIQRSKDDLDAQWAERQPEASANHEGDDTILLQPRMESKERDAMNLHKNTNVVDTKKLKRKSTARVSVHDTEPWQEPMQSAMDDYSDSTRNGINPFITSSAQLERLTLPSMASPMLQSLARPEAKPESESKRSISSTIPNTSVDSEPSHKAASAEHTGSSARMTTPTISGKSPHENLTQTTDHVNGALEYLGEDQQEDDRVHADQQSGQSGGDKQTVQVDFGSQESATEAKDELSMPSPAGNDLPSLESKKKSKRKLSQVENIDANGSDDAFIGLPAEQYQPRPSRSRANRSVDDLVLGINYSKRPEAVVKAKIKRRKTDGDHLVQKKHQAVDSSGRRATSPMVTNHGEASIPIDEPKPETILLPIEQLVVDVPSALEDVKAPPSEAEDAPKKKRGRPKKQPMVDSDVQIDGKVPTNGVDRSDSGELLASTSTAAPAAKTRKKNKKAAVTSVMLSEELVVEEDEDALASGGPPSAGLVEGNSNGVLDAKSDYSNIVKRDPQDPDTPTAPIQEVTPTFATSDQPPETPKKSTTKGPGKHSPLNTGKVPYRVGLSKRARIEPLLRVVRK